MKTFVTIAVVAVVAIVLVEINQSFAQGNSRRCREDRRPPLNTTEVTCERRGNIGRRLACAVQCRQCYGREQLQNLPGCLVDGKCTCLAKPGNEGSTTEGSSSDSTEPSDELSTTPELPTDMTDPELPSSDVTSPELPDISTPPSEDLPSTDGGAPPSEQLP